MTFTMLSYQSPMFVIFIPYMLMLESKEEIHTTSFFYEHIRHSSFEMNQKGT
jgi:hypothetical protein